MMSNDEQCDSAILEVFRFGSQESMFMYLEKSSKGIGSQK